VTISGNEAFSGGVYARLSGNTAHNGVVMHLTGDAVMNVRNPVVADNGGSGLGNYADSNLVYLHNTGDQNAVNLRVDGATMDDSHIRTAVIHNSNGGHIDVLSSMVFDLQEVYNTTGAGASSQLNINQPMT
jgi:hypothetical protein